MPKPKYDDVIAQRDKALAEIETLKEAATIAADTHAVVVAERDAYKLQLDAQASAGEGDAYAAALAEIETLKAEIETLSTIDTDPVTAGKIIVKTAQGRVRCADVIVESGEFVMTKELKSNKAFLEAFEKCIDQGLIEGV